MRVRLADRWCRVVPRVTRHPVLPVPGVTDRAGGVCAGPGDDRERGASPVELAIMFPTIMILLFSSIQMASVFLARSVALNAAQIGVNSTRVLGGVSEEEGEAQARQFVERAGDWLVPTTVNVEKGDVEVNATVSGQALSLIPGLTITVTQTARGPRERFTEDAG